MAYIDYLKDVFSINNIQNFFFGKRELFFGMTLETHNVIVLIGLCTLMILLLIYFVFRDVRTKGISIPSLPIGTRSDKPRFRKRDKIRYYATRFGRRIHDITDKLSEIKGKEEKREFIIQFAKKLFQKPESVPTIVDRSLPEFFFEPDIEDEEGPMPDEFKLILSSISVFGYVEKHFFLEICQQIETISLESGQYLFKVGNPDENIYVVQSGKVRVFVTEEDGNEMTIHEVVRGGNIHSLLSVLDVLTNNTQPYKTVSAKALTKCQILRLPTKALLDLCNKNPMTMIRIVQVIAVRLQRVTFMALHNYLGLSSELISRNNLAPPDSEVVALNNNDVNQYLQIPEDPVFLSKSLDCDPHLSSSISGHTHIAIERYTRPKYLKPRDRSRSHSPSGLIGSHYQEELHDTSSKGVFEGELEYGVALSAKRNSDTGRERAGSLKRKKRFNRANSIVDQSEYLLETGKRDIIKILGLKDESLLEDELSLHLVQAGTTLVKEGEQDDRSEGHLFFVVSGELQVLQRMVGGENKYLTLYNAHPGEMAGLLSVITAEPSYFTVRSPGVSRIIIITRNIFHKLLRAQPDIILKLGNLLVRRMSKFLRQIDFALEWLNVKAGRPLYKQGDIPECVYIMLNGRLRQIYTKPDGDKEVVAELGRGELVGFLEVFSHQPRATSVIAIRDSEMARIPIELLNMIKSKAPQVVSRLIQLLSDRLIGTITQPLNSPSRIACSNTMANLRAVAILPVSNSVNGEAFTLEIQHAMSTIGSSMRLTSEIVLKVLGSNALMHGTNEYRLASWLSQQEDLHRMIFYVCDQHPQSAWTRRCLRQADCMLILASAKSDPKLSLMETVVQRDHSKVMNILVLIYPEKTDYPTPGRAAMWLNNRPWVKQHFHIRVPPRVFTHKNSDSLLKLYKSVFQKESPSPCSDMSRLARHLTGNSVGLALGGGGARGISHAGIIRAFQEVGIPIDIVGGTSIGSFFGALWAEETRVTRFTQRAREFSKQMASVWDKILDITYPIVSMFSGRAFNKGLEGVFKNRQIEDLWLPYFCITTDISNSKMRVHTHGSVWRYVRASMSLSGYLPPLCDPNDGSLLLDGGYVNNVPADVMHSMGAHSIFAVDVGSSDDTDLYNYGDELSGWWLLYNRFIRRDIRVPSMTEIQSRLAYVSCVRQLEHVKETGICEYLRPPIENYATLQFGAFEEILDVGYKYAQEKIAEWRKHGLLNNFIMIGDYSRLKATQAMQSIRNLSFYEEKRNFVDLAEVISRIDKKTENLEVAEEYDSDCSDYLDIPDSPVDDVQMNFSDPEHFEFNSERKVRNRRLRSSKGKKSQNDRQVKFVNFSRHRSLDDLSQY